MRHRPPYSLPLAGLLCLLIAMLAACAAPSASPETLGPALPEQSPSPEPASPASGPDAAATSPERPPQLPPVERPGQRPDPEQVLRPGTGSPAGVAKLDYSCSSDSDCAVKNVGNCCGYYPACLNKDSPTNPEAVQAQCAKDGRMGVCGFPAISSCQCVQGRCEGSNELLPSL